MRYCATTPLEEYSSGMCVVFAERVSEISFRDDLDRRALALEPLAFRSLRRTLRISTGLNASRRRPLSQPSSTPPRRRDLRALRFVLPRSSYLPARTVQTRRTFCPRFHRFARVVRDADIVENQPTNPIRVFRREIRLAKDRSDVGLRRVPLFRRPKRPRRVASLPTMKTRFTNVLRVKI